MVAVQIKIITIIIIKQKVMANIIHVTAGQQPIEIFFEHYDKDVQRTKSVLGEKATILNDNE